MRAIHAMGLGLAVWAGGVSGARAQQPKAPAPIDFREMFLQLDANGDTAIDRDEVPEAGIAAFEKLLKLGDTNKDGRLEAAEMRAILEKVRDSNVFGTPEQRFKLMDKDGDGKLSLDEFRGPEPLFDRLDADKDGFLSKEELAQAREAAAKTKAAGKGKAKAKAAGPKPEAKPADDPKPAEGQLGPRLKAMDKDGDGKVSREEFTGPPALFDRLDLDKDGQLSASEAEKLRNLAGGGGGGRRFQAMDKDGDGKLSRDEFQGPRPLFDRLDADQDGSLSREEAAKAPAAGAAAKAKAKRKKDAND